VQLHNTLHTLDKQLEKSAGAEHDLGINGAEALELGTFKNWEQRFQTINRGLHEAFTAPFADAAGVNKATAAAQEMLAELKANRLELPELQTKGKLKILESQLRTWSGSAGVGVGISIHGSTSEGRRITLFFAKDGESHTGRPVDIRVEEPVASDPAALEVHIKKLMQQASDVRGRWLTPYREPTPTRDPNVPKLKVKPTVIYSDGDWIVTQPVSAHIRETDFGLYRIDKRHRVFLASYPHASPTSSGPLNVDTVMSHHAEVSIVDKDGFEVLNHTAKKPEELPELRRHPKFEVVIGNPSFFGQAANHVKERDWGVLIDGQPHAMGFYNNKSVTLYALNEQGNPLNPGEDAAKIRVDWVEDGDSGSEIYELER